MSQLTPMYYVRYSETGKIISFIEERVMYQSGTGRKAWFASEPASFTLEQAKAKLAKFEKAGYVWGQAYHAGFKERGFNVGKAGRLDPKEPSIEFGKFPEEAKRY